jgi:hypothetical protein
MSNLTKYDPEPASSISHSESPFILRDTFISHLLFGLGNSRFPGGIKPRTACAASAPTLSLLQVFLLHAEPILDFLTLTITDCINHEVFQYDNVKGEVINYLITRHEVYTGIR